MKNLPLWICSGALVAIGLMLAISIVATLGYFFVLVPLAREQQRQDRIQREPWRQWE